MLSDAGQVKATRATGIAHALQQSAVPAGQLWISCTDGYSALPPQWLATQLRHADRGADVLLVMVAPDARELSEAALRAWRSRPEGGAGHEYVFGASLGVRSDMYLRAGGFASVATGEDQMLVDAARRFDGRLVPTGDSVAVTSARQIGRAAAASS